MKNSSRLTFKLTLGRVDANEQVEEPLDGAMSAAPTRGQSPRRQRRHRHRHRHHQHRRRHHHLRNNNNNNDPHDDGAFHEQCRYSSDCQETRGDDLETSETSKQIREEGETRPKVNPIFLWALQREQKIVEVRCEDYDKRNRIKLTKTPYGWRSIPRTSSSVYNSCHCRSNYSANKDKPTSSSPSVSSSCVPCSMSSKSSSSSPSSYSESTSFSSRSSASYMANKSKDTCVVPEVSRKESGKRRRRSRYHVSDDESDATRSSCRNSRISFDLSCDDHHEEDPDDRDDYEERERFDDHDVHDGDYEFDDTQHENSRFLTTACGRKTFGLIDLEKVQKDSLLQPRVVLEPLNPSRYRFSNLIESSKLDDDIEMVVEDDDDDVEQGVESVKDNNKDNNNDNDGGVGKIDVNSVSVSVVRAEDTEEEIEEIEDDIKDNVEELDDENATVFEYDDRDSVEMMDDEELHEREDDVLSPDDKLPDSEFYQAHSVPTNKVQETCFEDDIIEEDVDQVQVNDMKIVNHRPRVPGSIPLPDLKPINDSLDKPRFPKTLQITRTCSQQVPPSPPCSVTCSEDASRPEIIRNRVMPSVIPEKRRREAPDLIEVKPTEWRRREALKPANQLRELIRKSGGSIPDPLLVPRDRLPILAASPAIEIPRLLITRPDLRLPEALSHPELLSDPDLLVISLSHLQQVLDAVPESRNRVQEDKTQPKSNSNYQQQPQYQPQQHQLLQQHNQHHTNNNNQNSSMSTHSEKKRLSCKPIGSLMPAPIDLSRHSSSVVSPAQNSILRVRTGLLRQESEVTSTARIPGDDSRLWHPLFGCRQKNEEKIQTKSLHQSQDSRLQHPGNYQQPQDTNSHRVSWHRTTLAS
ncbi:probable serine/threonine-protein kinase kinX [Microplitis mediator]|uniref:probable serine/threonine-protein kinase kinX n=1 Tax=Microplitis mediator TaxID=375433 RepID=UPI002555D7C1|nr:probable serine/threonine-protein kinase kinX [Microplitis mediator]